MLPGEELITEFCATLENMFSLQQIAAALDAVKAVYDMRVEETDSLATTEECEPLELAGRRSTARVDRKIISGSTPTEEAS